MLQPDSQQHPSQLYLIRVQAIVALLRAEPTMRLLCDRTQHWGWVMLQFADFFSAIVHLQF
jgi:hypothetical protein